MDRNDVRVARRSASHGNLNRSFDARGRARSDVDHHQPSPRSLRSTREHHFLDDDHRKDHPKYLYYNMLRKTTETGNIELCSLSAGKNRPLRARASLGDLRRPSPRVIPSCAGPGQEERIRPASPALTENGLVDYTRMVEIARTPQRTTHHPHAMLFPYKTTRDIPAPLAVKYDVNQSTRSFTDDPRSILRMPKARPPMPTQLHPWGLRPRHRLGSGSSGHSQRTSSLTSTNGGYGPPRTCTPKLPPAPRREPLFYDYSENFEDVAAEPPSDYQIASDSRCMSDTVSTGLAKCRRDFSSETADDDAKRAIEFLQQATMVESRDGSNASGSSKDLSGSLLMNKTEDTATQPPSGETADEALASSPVLPTPYPTAETSYFSASSSVDCRDEYRGIRPGDTACAVGPVAMSLTSEMSTVESPLCPETPDFDIGMPMTKPEICAGEDRIVGESEDGAKDEATSAKCSREWMGLSESVTTVVPRPELSSTTSVAFARQGSTGRRDSRLFSLGSGLVDLASFVKYMDKRMQTPQSDEPDQVELSMLPSSKSVPGGLNPVQRENGFSAPPRTSSLCRQGLEYAKMKANNPLSTDELDQYQVVSTRSGPTLVPQPISPVKMLRIATFARARTRSGVAFGSDIGTATV
ncbi:hypothetical protein M406DRAFT_332832 [Cryphonectria parasitica EP155]|uniref:Uncharacterized protein n=1 Tax=Cryphonectria parasitica (strain ATCC 38755 / EP155) TaxID=660469 RepID=A0A9P4XX04_CRYP1|nr:uncharacterized protein M406DRAFT_332832 [Cryphonectria parasitica EP155]KAF3762451.1 hypothetical protein M406DRAFT_332832 [Cryphonectria parasitica EP155]